MSVERKVPAIRFKGFGEDWDRKDVGEFYDFKNGLNKGKEYFGYGVPIVNFTDVFHNRGLLATKLKGKVCLTSKEVKNFEVKKGDIFFTRTSETIEEIGYPSVMMDNTNSVVFSGFVLRARAIGEDPLALLFKQYVFFTRQFRKEMVKKSSMTTRALTSGTAIKKMSFVYPVNKMEQTKIGNYFQQLDTLITQHQKKHDKLLKVKKALLEKMFPKQGQAEPEIRFKGFSGGWETKKITELSKVFIGLVTTMTKYYRNDGVLLIRNSDIKNNRFEFSEDPIYLDNNFADENSGRKLGIGDVVTVHTGDVGTSAVITKNEEGAIGFATIITRPKKEMIDSNYLSTYLNSDIHKRYAISVSTGDGRANYNLKDFYEVKVTFPEKKEQKKIGDLFKYMDNLINYHYTQLKKLNNIKRACLAKMFV